MRDGVLTIAVVTLLAAFTASPAFAFCVVNAGKHPIDIHSGGQPMPVDARYGLKPGERYCYVPRKPEGIMVEIFENPKAAQRRLKCRLSVPARNADVQVGESCRVKID